MSYVISECVKKGFVYDDFPLFTTVNCVYPMLRVHFDDNSPLTGRGADTIPLLLAFAFFKVLILTDLYRSMYLIHAIGEILTHVNFLVMNS